MRVLRIPRRGCGCTSSKLMSVSDEPAVHETSLGMTFPFASGTFDGPGLQNVHTRFDFLQRTPTDPGQRAQNASDHKLRANLKGLSSR